MQGRPTRCRQAVRRGKGQIVVVAKLIDTARHIGVPYAHRFARHIDIGHRLAVLARIGVAIIHGQEIPGSVGHECILNYRRPVEREVSIVTFGMSDKIIACGVGARSPHTVTHGVDRHLIACRGKLAVAAVADTESAGELRARLDSIEIDSRHRKSAVGYHMGETVGHLNLIERDIVRLGDDDIKVVGAG